MSVTQMTLSSAAVTDKSNSAREPLLAHNKLLLAAMALLIYRDSYWSRLPLLPATQCCVRHAHTHTHTHTHMHCPLMHLAFVKGNDVLHVYLRMEQGSEI